MSESEKRTYKAFPLVWDEIAQHDNETDKYRPLTERQSAILIAAIQHYAWPTRWVELGISAAELEREISDIRDRLMREAGEMTMDYDALEDAINNGIYKAFNGLAAQVVSGGRTGFTVNEDGTITVGNDAANGGNLPDDDEGTLIDETLSAKMGGAIAVGKAIELYLSRVDSYYGVTNGSPVNTQAASEALLSAYFPTNEIALDYGLTIYYDYRSNPTPSGNPRILFTSNAAFFQYLYCKGISALGFKRWLVDVSGYSTVKIGVVSDLIDALTDEFWSGYYSEGIVLPSTSYQDAACVPMPPQTYTGMLWGVTILGNPLIPKKKHRLKIIVSGYYLDPDGDIQDAFWYRNALTGALTRSNFNFTHGGGSNMPSSNEVPYSSSHVYEYTIDLLDGIASWEYRFNRYTAMDVASTSPTAGYSLSIVDLGEY